MKNKSFKILLCCFAFFFFGCGQGQAEKIEETKKPVVEHYASSDYHYNQLTEEEKEVYDHIVNVCKNYEESLEFENPHSYDVVMQAMTAIFHDHPELFWSINFSANLDEQNMAHSIDFHDMKDNKEQIQAQVTEVEKKADQIIANIPDPENRYEVIKYFFETIVNETTYDREAPYHQDIRSVFLYQRSVCAGFSRAFQYLCDKVSIPCIHLTGELEQDGKVDSHAWNMVQIGESWYWVDPTNGEIRVLDELTGKEVERQGEINYGYICFGDDVFNRGYRIKEQSFTSDIPFTLRPYTYPKPTDNNYEFCHVNGCGFTTYDRNEISSYVYQQLNTNPNKMYFKFYDDQSYQEAKQDLFSPETNYFGVILGTYYPYEVQYYCTSYDMLGFMEAGVMGP